MRCYFGIFGYSRGFFGYFVQMLRDDTFYGFKGYYLIKGQSLGKKAGEMSKRASNVEA